MIADLCKKCFTECRSSLWLDDSLCSRCRSLNGGYYRLNVGNPIKRDYKKFNRRGLGRKTEKGKKAFTHHLYIIDAKSINKSRMVDAGAISVKRKHACHYFGVEDCPLPDEKELHD